MELQKEIDNLRAFARRVVTILREIAHQDYAVGSTLEYDDKQKGALITWIRTKANTMLADPLAQEVEK